MVKPAILLTGTPEVCLSISGYFKGKALFSHIPAKRLSYDTIRRRKPLLICIATEKDADALNNDYAAVMKYSKRTRCPVYVLCTEGQYSLAADEHKDANIYPAVLSDLPNIIGSALKFAAENAGDRLSLIKSRFESVVLMSDNAALAACCENSVNTAGITGKRIILTSSDCDDISEITENENSCSAIILTENLFGDFSDGLALISNTDTELKAPVLLIGTDSARCSPERVCYVNIENEAEIDGDNENGVISAIRKITC